MSKIQAYKTLKQEYKLAKNQLDCTATAISVTNYANSNAPKQHSCVMYDDYAEPTNPYMGEYVSMVDFMPTYTVNFCPEMKYCTKITCPTFEKLEAFIAQEQKCHALDTQLNQFPLWVKIASLFVKTRNK